MPDRQCDRRSSALMLLGSVVGRMQTGYRSCNVVVLSAAEA